MLRTISGSQWMLVIITTTTTRSLSHSLPLFDSHTMSWVWALCVQLNTATISSSLDHISLSFWKQKQKPKTKKPKISSQEYNIDTKLCLWSRGNFKKLAIDSECKTSSLNSPCNHFHFSQCYQIKFKIFEDLGGGSKDWAKVSTILNSLLQNSKIL